MYRRYLLRNGFLVRQTLILPALSPILSIVRLVRFLFHVNAAGKAEGKGAVPCQLLIILIAAAGAVYYIMVLAQQGSEGTIVKGGTRIRL